MKYEEQIKLRTKIEMLSYLLNRECDCDKSKCSEHFNHIRSLKYEYQIKLDELDEKK